MSHQEAEEGIAPMQPGSKPARARSRIRRVEGPPDVGLQLRGLSVSVPGDAGLIIRDLHVRVEPGERKVQHATHLGMPKHQAH